MLVIPDILWPVVCAAVIVYCDVVALKVGPEVVQLYILLLVVFIPQHSSRIVVWVVGRQAKLTVADVLDCKLV